MKEIWKKIPGYEGYYSASNFGNIRREKSEKNTFSGRIMSLNSNDRYIRISLTKNGIQKIHSVHRLIALTFLKSSIDKNYVNHKDCNKKNNNINNLEYVTAKENKLHSVKNGIQCGSKCYNAKLNENQVIEIREIYGQGNISQQELANEYKVSQVLISIIVLRKRWKYI